MKTITETILGIVLLVWFLGTFVVICSITEDNEWLIPALLGQLFVVWGIVFLGKKIVARALEFQDSIWFLFILVGIGCIAASFIQRFGSEEVLDICLKIFPYVFLSLFVFVGAFMGRYNYQTKILSAREGMEMIEAECVEVRELLTEKKYGTYMAYCPVYCFHFKGNAYTVSGNVYVKRTDLRVGNKYKIYIDPYRPRWFHDPKQDIRAEWMPVIMWGFFVVFPIIVMILYTKTLLS